MASITSMVCVSIAKDANSGTRPQDSKSTRFWFVVVGAVVVGAIKTSEPSTTTTVPVA
jgi:hypothetical protein